jgi:hypothetical protein
VRLYNNVVSFLFVAYKWVKYARVFFSGKPIQLDLMFASKDVAYPTEASLMCSTLRLPLDNFGKHETGCKNFLCYKTF